MVSVVEAQQHLFLHPLICDTELVPLAKCLNRVLSEPIRADRDFPPYDRVAMDGIAINAEAFRQGRRIFSIEATIAAGQSRYSMDNNLNCVEIMTGAVLPIGCDTVVRYEDIQISDGQALLKELAILGGENVHVQGSDRKKGSIIVPARTLLSASELGVAATVGDSELSVFRIPPICLVSTGDELVNIEQTPAPHQIRSSNAVALRAILAKWAMEIDHQHILDDEKKVRSTITKLLSKYQIIIFMGGSSMGKFDFIPGILRKSGVTEHFYKIKQRPGKPMWFGSKGNQFVFALPGNPVSCFLCAERYVDAWLRHSLGIKQRVNKAILRRSFDFKPALSYFLQVKLTNENGCLFADPIPGSGSGDHANLANTDAFMELPEGKDSYREGEQFYVFPFKPIL